MELTYYGHSCFSVQWAGFTLLFDPFIRNNPLAAQVDIGAVKADWVVISHGHQDHLADAIEIAGLNQATIVGAFEVTSWFSSNGYEKVLPMNLGGTLQAGNGTLKGVVAQHSSSLPDGSYGGHPMGFAVHTPEGDFYYAGDTSLTTEMQLIPLWIQPTFAVLPIGDHYTMGARDAAIAAEWVKAPVVVGVHFDTFGHIKVDKSAAQEAFSEKQIELKLPPIGGKLNF